jgi:TPR repeat protein
MRWSWLMVCRACVGQGDDFEERRECLVKNRRANHTMIGQQVEQVRKGDQGALKSLVAEARSGNADAQLALGHLYGYGQGGSSIM